MTMEPMNDAMELFRHQRAVRAFSDKPVTDDTVDQILQAAIHGPSGSNTQPWHFIVVRDQAVKDQLSDAYEEGIREAYGDATPARGADRQPLSAAPVLIIPCVDTPPSNRAGFQTGASIYPNAQNLMLAARALGLGTVLTTLHRRRKERVHEILAIPEGIESAAIIPLGWPTRSYGPNQRPPLANFVMQDRWRS
jgi:nitroreductase